MWPVVVTTLVLLVVSVRAQTSTENPINARVCVGNCPRVCGAYEACFLYENAAYCAPYCAPGRCNDATEVCVARAAHACDRAPCLPAVACEPKTAQLQLATPTSVRDLTSAACARQCPLQSAPVCGSDGTSYANECFFEQAQCATPSLSLAYVRICDADVAFNAQYNSAAATSAPAASTHPAECDAIVCSTVDDPVCTTSGTMANLCLWRKAQCVDASVDLVQRTACDASSLMAACPASCTDEYVPVCASNGVMYGNECLFRQAKCARRAFGELRARDLSFCELQVGDSQGLASDVASILASTAY